MYVLDVGQADSILFVQDDKVMLVDAGTKAKSDDVIDYLNKLGIKKIDILVGTHPHDDHMGGMGKIIQNFEVGTIYTPNIENEEITTVWYMDFLDAVDEKNVNWKYAKAGDNIEFGQSSIKVLGPVDEKYEDLNNYSLVLKLTFGETRILLTGDAERLSETEIINTGENLESDILKVGHHGSSSSTSDKFLRMVNPKYAIISVGKGNTYGHPNGKVLERLEKYGIKIYRTDEMGTIVITTDGKNIEIKN